jgi:glucosamine--fructose-6-phosphate aminotransferase (isomerizing)
VLIPKNGDLRSKTLTSIYEVQSRGGQVIALAQNGDIEVQALADAWITVPTDDDEHAPFVMTIPLQQLAYHIAVARGYNPDRPRNLAKTVTVA